jgi:uncharacterized membrane protein
MNASLILLAEHATMPNMNGTYWLLLLSRVCHVVGAIILVGGLFYIRYVLSPANAPAGTAPVDQLFGGRRATWAKWVGIATALLLITGIANYISIKRTAPLPKSYDMIIGMKMLAAIVLFLLAALLAGRTSAADALRQKWRMWLGICLVVSLITIVLGSMLRTMHLSHKTHSSEPPQLMAPANAPQQ